MFRVRILQENRENNQMGQRNNGRRTTKGTKKKNLKKWIMLIYQWEWWVLEEQKFHDMTLLDIWKLMRLWLSFSLSTGCSRVRFADDIFVYTATSQLLCTWKFYIERESIPIYKEKGRGETKNKEESKKTHK